MKRRISAGGYTILEVVIVLTVTSALFLSVGLLFSGKQGKTQTVQAARDLESNIHSLISDVSNGYFPTDLGCRANNSPGTTPEIIDPTGNGGDNKGCIFLGKFMYFGKSKATVYTTLGRQYVGAFGSKTVGNFTEARPLIVDDTASEYYFFHQMEVTSVRALSSGTSFKAIGYLTDIGSVSGSPINGSRNVVLYGIAGLVDGIFQEEPSYTQLKQGIRICLEGANGQKAELKVGESGNVTNTELTIDVKAPNVCA